MFGADVGSVLRRRRALGGDLTADDGDDGGPVGAELVPRERPSEGAVTTALSDVDHMVCPAGHVVVRGLRRNCAMCGGPYPVHGPTLSGDECSPDNIAYANRTIETVESL